MNKFGKYTLIAIGLNVLSFVIFCIPVFLTPNTNDAALSAFIIAFFLGVISLVVQLIVALVYLFGQKKEVGKAMLLSIGIILLVGLSICSTA